MMLPPFARTVMRGGLLTTAIACVVFSGLSMLATVSAGSLQMDGGYPDGPANLLFSSLAVVRFKGIVAADAESKGYQLSMLWFLNAFGWEWPTAAWEKSCGIVHNVDFVLPGAPLTLPEDLASAAKQLRLPYEDYGCLDKYSRAGHVCENEFLLAWYAAKPNRTSFNTLIPSILYLFAGCLLFATAQQELAARWFPSLLRCHCPSFISKRNLCTCLKEGEEATPEKRNRMRIVALLVTAGTYVIGAVILTCKAGALVRYVNQVDAKVGGMNAHIGHGFIGLTFGTVSAILVAVLCLELRGRIRKGKSWMEEQIGVDAIGIEHVDEADGEEEEDSSS